MPSPAKPIYEWTARIEFDKHELGSSFGVHIFLGDLPDNSREWQTSPNLVGSHYAFVSSAQSYGYGGPGGGLGGIEEGFVHLNRGIVSHSGLPSLEPEVVEPYLTEAMQWRVQLVNILSTTMLGILKLHTYRLADNLPISTPLKLRYTSHR